MAAMREPMKTAFFICVEVVSLSVGENAIILSAKCS